MDGEEDSWYQTYYWLETFLQIGRVAYELVLRGSSHAIFIKDILFSHF